MNLCPTCGFTLDGPLHAEATSCAFASPTIKVQAFQVRRGDTVVRADYFDKVDAVHNLGPDGIIFTLIESNGSASEMRVRPYDLVEITRG